MNKRGKKRGKTAQLNLSFGMIFSVILIIVFLVAGFYAIKKFVELQQTIQIQNFLKNFQDDVDKMWKSAQGSQVVTYALPTKISSICFSDDEFWNLKFTSNEIIQGKMINNIDITSITAKESPYCIMNVKGKVSLTIVKDFGETLVRVER
jgi:hypothetical protein